MPNNESKTSRTDAAITTTRNPDNKYQRYQVEADFARTLQLELSALTEENKKLKEELEAANQRLKNNAILSFAKYAELCAVSMERDQLKAILFELQKELAEYRS